MNPMLFLDEPSRETLNISPQYFQGSEKHFKRYVSTPLSCILSDFSFFFDSESATTPKKKEESDLTKKIIDLLENSFKKGGLSNEDRDAIVEKTKEWKAVIIESIKLRCQNTDFFLTDKFLNKNLFKRHFRMPAVGKDEKEKEKKAREEREVLVRNAKEKTKEEGEKVVSVFVLKFRNFKPEKPEDYFFELRGVVIDFRKTLTYAVLTNRPPKQKKEGEKEED